MLVERILDPGVEWDAFVEATPGALVGHAAAWATIFHRVYRLEHRYLAARDQTGALCGVLPMVRFRDLRGRRELVSLPFLDAAGILAATPEAEHALLDAALEETRAWGARCLELRDGPRRALTSGAPAIPGRVNLALPLEDSEEAQWKALPGKVRNQTRKANREGLTLAKDDAGLAERFYGPFRINMRDLGSPVHSSRFFSAASDAFGPRLRFVIAEDGRQTVGGLVAIHFAGAVTVPWASTLQSERRRCPNNLIYWEAIRWAIEQRAQVFDFGRSPVESGTHRFKRGWGAQDQPLAWVRYDPRGATIPFTSAGDSGLLQLLSRTWTHLPLGLANALGPRLRGRLSN